MNLLGRLFFTLYGNGRCSVCNNPLQINEKDVCVRCLMDLPYTNIHAVPDNKLERYFWERIPIVGASAWLVYHQGARSHVILQRLKYGDKPSIGVTLGRMMAQQLMYERASFFSSIDMIVPVPLNKVRQRKRGYNQAECLAVGISEITGIPVVTEGVCREVANATQTRLTRVERQENVRGIFSVKNGERFDHKHVLLVDDVVTSGATLTELADAFKGCKNVRFSILALAMAASITAVPFYKEERSDEDNGEGEIFIP